MNLWQSLQQSRSGGQPLGLMDLLMGQSPAPAFTPQSYLQKATMPAAQQPAPAQTQNPFGIPEGYMFDPQSGTFRLPGFMGFQQPGASLLGAFGAGGNGGYGGSASGLGMGAAAGGLAGGAGLLGLGYGNAAY